MKNTHQRDETLYKNGKQLRIDMLLYIPPECEGEPSMTVCRYAVLPLRNNGYVVYDRVVSRVVNGVWWDRRMALEVAQMYNREPGYVISDDNNPSGAPLGLIFPE